MCPMAIRLMRCWPMLCIISSRRHSRKIRPGMNLLNNGSERPDMYKASLEILASISKLPLALKIWRREVNDIFLESRFWKERTVSELWRVVIHALYSDDMTDILSRITAVPSSSIFGSKESEVLLRSYSIKRLSFVMYAAPVDYWLKVLPAIQEKIVEVLKGPGGVMHVEAWLALRVMLMRISHVHLSNLWPIVVTEMMRIFARVGDLDVFYAAGKFLDLVLCLGVEVFRMHEWVFVVDTFEGLGGKSGALVERIGSEYGLTDTDSSSAVVYNDGLYRLGEVSRRPVLVKKNIKAVEEMGAFIAGAGRRGLLGAYLLEAVDSESVERGLGDDIFE
jgi:hypothetical protein